MERKRFSILYETLTPTEVPKIVWYLVTTFVIVFYLFEGVPFLADPFHQGEFFALSSEIREFGFSHIPVSIHGLLDLFPALLTQWLFGSNNNFLPTVALYKILNLFSAISLVALAGILTPLTRQDRRWLLLGVALISPYVVNYRDTFLLAALLVFVVLVVSPKRHPTTMILMVLFGTLTTANFLWSFDRGISGTVAMGIATLYLARDNKWYLLPIGTFVLALLILPIYWPTFSLMWYLENVRVLLETSSQWGYGLKFAPVILSVYGITFNAVVLIPVIVFFRQKRQEISQNGLLIALSILALFFVKIGTNRADLGHISFSLWLPMLIGIRWGDNLTNHVRNNPKLIILYLSLLATVLKLGLNVLPLFLISQIALAWPSLQSENPNRRTRMAFRLLLVTLTAAALTYDIVSMEKGRYAWLTDIIRPPANIDISPQSNVWAAERILKSGSKCVFDLTNNGLINGLTHLPPCTRFLYPVYATQRYEKELIKGVSVGDPNVIVYSASFWSYSIDGRSMVDRFPNLDIFLRKRYPVMECSFGYCLRYKAK